jgi:hypothetical protein
MYNKIIELPMSYYSEKGDIMFGDVNEVQTPFSILETSYKKNPYLAIFFFLH